MLNVALIGCGRIAVRHADLLAGGHIGGARLAAVCDIVPERAHRLGDKYGVPAFTDLHELARSGCADVFSVLTPSGLHAEHVIALAKYSRHIIVEKPMALNLEDADEMIRACDRAGIKLFVVMQNRFNVPILKLREALDAGRFGKLVLGTVRVRRTRTQEYYDQDAWRGTWALDGGVLSNQASHHVDLLQWMFGPVESVFAKTSTALVDIEAEDTAVVVLKFRSGALGIIEATTATRPVDLEGSISVLGEHATVEVAGFAANEIRTWNFTKPEPDDAAVVRDFSVNPPNLYGFGHQAYYEHVVDSIAGNAQQLVDGHEGRKSLEVISAIYESVDTGREIALHVEPKRSRLGHGLR